MNFQGTIKIRELHRGTFPKVPSHDHAVCMCGEPLRTVRTKTDVVNGVPKVSEGQWFGQCSKECGLGGFYDLEI